MLKNNLLPYPDIITVNGSSIYTNYKDSIIKNPKVIKTVKEAIKNEAGFYKDSSVSEDAVGPLPSSDSDS